MEVQVRYLPLLFFFVSYRQIRVYLDEKSSHEYAVNYRVPKGSNFGPILSLLYINDRPDDVICNIC